MTAQEYYQTHPQAYGPVDPPPQYQPYGSPAQRPTWPQQTNPHPYPGTPQPQPFQQPFLAPQNQQQQRPQRPPMPPQIQTHQPYPQSNGPQAPQVLPAHLRPTRSYSEPPSPRDYERHRRRGASHDRRRRSPSPSDSESDYTSRSRSRSRHRHRERDVRPVHPSARKLGWADKARGKKEYVSRDNRDHATRNTFFGAFGGGAIGDLIAPGLGTLGGALLGGLGGHEAGRSRSGSGPDGGRSRKRDKYDEEWEEGRRRRGEI